MEYYLVAAKWWGNKLRKISKRSYNNGEKATPEIANMAENLARIYKPTEEQIVAFENDLSEFIKNELETNPFGLLIIHCDYDPDYRIRPIADKYGINYICFPFKTTMSITKDKITVSCGYRARKKTIFDRKKEEL